MNKNFQSLYVNNEKRRLVPTVLYILMAFMGAAGTVFSFVSCFSFDLKLPFYLIWIVLTLGVCLFYLIDWFRDKLLLMLLLGSMSYVVFCLDKVLASAIKVCNIVIRDINTSYSMRIRMIVLPDNLPHDVGVETVLVLLTIVITFLTAYFVLGRSSVLGCLCVSMPFCIFGIFFDIFPRLEFMLLSVTFWVVAVVLHASGKRGERIADGAVYNGLFAAVSIWIIYFVSQAVAPAQQYVRNDVLENAKIVIEKNVSIFANNHSGGRAGIGNGTFGDQSQIYFTGETVLEVTLPDFEQNIYLRTAEYNEYIGNVWENNDTYFQNYFNDRYEYLGREQHPQNITSFILENLKAELYAYDADLEDYEELVTEYQIRVRNFTYSDAPFAPYGTKFNVDRMRTDVMPSSNRTSVSKYTVYMTGDILRFCELFPAERFFSRWNMISVQLPTIQDTIYYQTLSAEEEYASFVRKAYTQVPEDLRDVLGRYVPGVVEYDYASEMAFADEVRSMFAQNYQYTLAPGRVPDGIDGVEYFLNESRKGYCVYFASAATLIFRQAGIPARYVEGFIITPDMMENPDEDGIVTVSVSDDKAHAWPEIYIAGYGWVPIEVTPGFYQESIDRGQVEAQISIEELLKEGEDEEDDDTETETHAGKENEDEEIEDDVPDWRFTGILAVLGIALAVGIVCCVFKLSGREHRKKVFELFNGGEGVDSRKRVLLAWWYIEKLLLFKKVKIPDNLTVCELKKFLKGHFESFSNADWDDRIDCIMEVYFGNKMPSVEETNNIVETAGHLRSDIYMKLKWIGKIRFRFIHRL